VQQRIVVHRLTTAV